MLFKVLIPDLRLNRLERSGFEADFAAQEELASTRKKRTLTAQCRTSFAAVMFQSKVRPSRGDLSLSEHVLSEQYQTQCCDTLTRPVGM